MGKGKSHEKDGRKSLFPIFSLCIVRVDIIRLGKGDEGRGGRAGSGRGGGAGWGAKGLGPCSMGLRSYLTSKGVRAVFDGNSNPNAMYVIMYPRVSYDICAFLCLIFCLCLCLSVRLSVDLSVCVPPVWHFYNSTGIF